MQAAKSMAVRLSVTLTLRQGRCTSRKMNRLASTREAWSSCLNRAGWSVDVDRLISRGWCLMADTRQPNMGWLHREAASLDEPPPELEPSISKKGHTARAVSGK